MKQGKYKIRKNEFIAKNTLKMILDGDTSNITKPGQFINIKLDGLFLRRPISVCDFDEKSITIIYKVVGKGTEEMSKMKEGFELDILTALGNGYDILKSGHSPVLVGGGLGIPPLYKLCKVLIENGKEPKIVLGYNSIDEVFFEDEFKSITKEVYVCTADGSYGEKGLVVDIVKRLNYTYFYSCGPLPMFRALEKIFNTSGQYSFEERMGCGFGACMGCSCKTRNGSKRICKEGPVFEREEIIW